MLNVEPFYFGAAGELFGVYSPALGVDTNRAALLPQLPFSEQSAFTWTYNRLAAVLSQSGIHVLRFDPFGCGNSQGDLMDTSLAIWRDNIRTARQELIASSGADTLIVLGTRFMACLCADVVDTGDLLICFEPEFSGVNYLSDLQTRQQEIQAANGGDEIPKADELAGFSVNLQFVHELASCQADPAVLAHCTVVASRRPKETVAAYHVTAEAPQQSDMEFRIGVHHQNVTLLAELISSVQVKSGDLLSDDRDSQ